MERSTASGESLLSTHMRLQGLRKAPTHRAHDAMMAQYRFAPIATKSTFNLGLTGSKYKGRPAKLTATVEPVELVTHLHKPARPATTAPRSTPANPATRTQTAKEDVASIGPKASGVYPLATPTVAAHKALYAFLYPRQPTTPVAVFPGEEHAQSSHASLTRIAPM